MVTEGTHSPGFVHLHVHSNYTLSRGASTLGELLRRARELDGALGLTTMAEEVDDYS